MRLVVSGLVVKLPALHHVQESIECEYSSRFSLL